jgi:hypothetical protein
MDTTLLSALVNVFTVVGVGVVFLWIVYQLARFN